MTSPRDAELSVSISRAGVSKFTRDGEEEEPRGLPCMQRHSSSKSNASNVSGLPCCWS